MLRCQTRHALRRRQGTGDPLSPPATNPARTRPQDAEGWRVIEAALEAAAEIADIRIVAAYALGSLAHGGFSTATSDVDLAVILTAIDTNTADEIRRVCERAAAALDIPLATRLSVFWSTWSALHTGVQAGRFPLVDRCDLVASGLLLAGEDRRAQVRLPAPERMHGELLLESARFMLERLATSTRDARLRDPAELLAQGCREVTKTILFPVRFIYTAETGHADGNDPAALHYASRPASAVRELVTAAMQWRRDGQTHPVAHARAQLANGLLPLYRELTDVYEDMLRQMEQTQLADQMRQWRRRLS